MKTDSPTPPPSTEGHFDPPAPPPPAEPTAPAFQPGHALEAAALAHSLFAGAEPLRGEALAILEQTLKRTTTKEPRFSFMR